MLQMTAAPDGGGQNVLGEKSLTAWTGMNNDKKFGQLAWTGMNNDKMFGQLGHHDVWMEYSEATQRVA